MVPNTSNVNPAAASDLATPHTSNCATSPDTELMRRADDTRTAYYANVRRVIAEASGESPFNVAAEAQS